MFVQKIYNLILVFGALAAVLFYAAAVLSEKATAGQKSAALGVMLPITFASLAVGCLVSAASGLSAKTPQLFVSAAAFLLLVTLASKALYKASGAKLYACLPLYAAKSVFIFAAVSKCACLIAGCCHGFGGSRLPVITEILFCLTAAALASPGIIKADLREVSAAAAAALYAAFRFFIEFVRDNSFETLYYGLNVRQIFAIVVIAVVLSAYALALRRHIYNEKSNEITFGKNRLQA